MFVTLDTQKRYIQIKNQRQQDKQRGDPQIESL